MEAVGFEGIQAFECRLLAARHIFLAGNRGVSFDPGRHAVVREVGFARRVRGFGFVDDFGRFGQNGFAQDAENRFFG